MADKIVTFAQFLGQAENGQLHQDLSDELRNLIGDLSNVFAASGGKPKGKLTLNLSVKLDSGAFVFDADIKTVAPKRARETSIFWATPENNLTNANPRQQRLPLHDVVSPAREVV